MDRLVSMVRWGNLYNAPFGSGIDIQGAYTNLSEVWLCNYHEMINIDLKMVIIAIRGIVPLQHEQSVRLAE